MAIACQSVRCCGTRHRAIVVPNLDKLSGSVIYVTKRGKDIATDKCCPRNGLSKARNNRVLLTYSRALCVTRGK